jgi:hypothetical protein
MSRATGAHSILAALDRVAARQPAQVVNHARLPDPVDFAVACGAHRAPRFERDRCEWTRDADAVTCSACRDALRRWPSMVDRMREEAESEGFADRLEHEEAGRLAREAADRDAWTEEHSERGYRYGDF